MPTEEKRLEVYLRDSSPEDIVTFGIGYAVRGGWGTIGKVFIPIFEKKYKTIDWLRVDRFIDLVKNKDPNIRRYGARLCVSLFRVYEPEFDDEVDGLINELGDKALNDENFNSKFRASIALIEAEKKIGKLNYRLDYKKLFDNISQGLSKIGTEPEQVIKTYLKYLVDKL